MEIDAVMPTREQQRIAVLFFKLEGRQYYMHLIEKEIPLQQQILHEEYLRLYRPSRDDRRGNVGKVMKFFALL